MISQQIAYFSTKTYVVGTQIYAQKFPNLDLGSFLGLCRHTLYMYFCVCEAGKASGGAFAITKWSGVNQSKEILPLLQFEKQNKLS